MWDIEQIPDEDSLYVRVHHSQISSKDYLPKETAFLNTPTTGPDLSSDWDKYANLTYCREVLASQKNHNGEYKNPAAFFYYKFRVLSLRELKASPQNVEHSPVYNIVGMPDNRAHSSIIGEKVNNAEFRAQMLRAGVWAEDIPKDLPQYRKEMNLK
jgi:hypothetical protein